MARWDLAAALLAMAFVGWATPLAHAQADCAGYAFEPTSVTIPSEGGQATATLRAPAGCAYTQVSDDDDYDPWLLTADPPTFFTTQGPATEFRLTANANDEVDGRVGHLQLEVQSTREVGMILVVQQPGRCRYNVSPTELRSDAAGGPGTFAVATQTGCKWTLGEPSSWLSFRLAGQQVGSQDVQFTVARNEGGARTGGVNVHAASLDVFGVPVFVNQSGVSASSTGNASTGDDDVDRMLNEPGPDAALLLAVAPALALALRRR